MMTFLAVLMLAALVVAALKYRFVPFGMTVLPPHSPKRTLVFHNAANITATTNPVFRFKAGENMIPLVARITPLSEFDFTTTDETYVLSVEDDGTKISTDNAAISALNKTLALEATFASGTRIAEGSYVEIIVTLGGTTPIIPAGSVFELEYAPV